MRQSEALADESVANGATTTTTRACEAQVAGSIETSWRERAITITLANGAVHEALAAGPEGGELVLLLHPVREEQFFGALDKISALPDVHGEPAVIRVEGDTGRS